MRALKTRASPALPAARALAAAVRVPGVARRRVEEPELVRGGTTHACQAFIRLARSRAEPMSAKGSRDAAQNQSRFDPDMGELRVMVSFGRQLSHARVAVGLTQTRSDVEGGDVIDAVLRSVRLSRGAVQRARSGELSPSPTSTVTAMTIGRGLVGALDQLDALDRRRASWGGRRGSGPAGRGA